MFRPTTVAGAMALALGMPLAAQAQSGADLDEVRKQIQELKDAYESRLRSLEKRLQDAEQKAAAAQSSANAAQSSANAAQASAQEAGTRPVPVQQASQNAFNPAISLILMGTYGNFSNDPTKYAITGFQPPGATTPGDRGFSIGESELFITANVDHLFMGALNFAMEPDNTTSVEEAYFQTLALGHGLTIKGGRFFSALGYQNSIHAHAWDFVDTSLVQRAFLGDNYGDDGVQVVWVAPLPVYVDVGAELGRGRTLAGNFAGASELSDNELNKNGAGSRTVFAHVGGDVGDSNAYRVGVSALHEQAGGGTPFQVADLPVTFLPGDVQLYGADFVWKWAPQGNYQYTNFKFIAEWFEMHRNGNLSDQSDTFREKQSGWYMQGTYQFHPYWRVGLRYDQLQTGTFQTGTGSLNVQPADYTPKRYSAMIDWNPSEFSRIRLQYNEDKSQQFLTDHQIFLQYIYSLGTHGAHRF